tara:strand:+ start:755 stop:982 length:228 start_codon:yes stop_codon:yes gene_type:complete
MNTKDIPKGWWLNVTVMARFPDYWIVGIIRKGKESWITEEVIGNVNTPEEAYNKGLEFINEYLIKKLEKNKHNGK